MKRTLPFIFLFFISISLSAQQLPKILDGGIKAVRLAQPSPLPALNENPVAPAPSLQFRDEEVQIGLTRFDIQSIGSMGRRVADFPDGKVSAAWQHGLDQSGGWPDRGTAYNLFDGSGWGAIPDFSLEATRSGYPSFTNTPNGLEVVISHKNTSATQWYLQCHTKTPTDTDWTAQDIPSTVTGGPVWAKVATGGADGNSIHVVAVAVAPDFGGVIYEGINQHPLYYRSTDAGATWDKVDVIIPGLDSSFYNTVGGENYNIYANGETVAVAIFESWGDIAVFKSTDNGETWEKRIVNDFPLDKYDDMGYEPGDVPFDPAVPDSISIFSTDGSGSVLVDDNGKVHVFYSILYVFAEGADRFLNLTVDGIAYWNEDFATNEREVIAAAPDLDGDGVVTVTGTFDQLRYNNSNFTSFPTSSIDDEGNIYLVYSTIREDFLDFNELSIRHIFIIKSSDGGLTWSEPFDLINPDVVEFYEFIEAQYPSIPSRIGDKIEMVYMQDFDAGLTPTNATATDQYIVHISYDKETFEPNFSNETTPFSSEVILIPNPAFGKASVQFEIREKSNVSFHIFDTLGKRVYSSKVENLQAGNNTEWLNLEGLANGLYFVQLAIGGQKITKKLVIGE
jgi:hypothetical protein